MADQHTRPCGGCFVCAGRIPGDGLTCESPIPMDEHGRDITLEDALRQRAEAAEQEVARLRAQLREAADALCDVGKAALVVKNSLEKPYPDAPDWSPWTRFMGAPAKRAYNLGHRIRADSPQR